MAVDPFVGGRFGGPATRERFDRHMAALGLTDIVDLVVDRSTAVRPGWTETIDLLYIDGKHDYWTVSDDLRWRAFLPPGGRLLVHDSFSSIGVTLALLRHGLGAPDLAYVGRVGSLARFERRRPRPAERLRLLGELPWWLRNVAIKITLRARRLTSRDVPPDPY